MCTYLKIQQGDDLPNLEEIRPFKAIVVVESEVTVDWQYQVSHWLINRGCLCMMAWGKDCSSWDDSVDMANLERWNYDEIPDHAFVMTSWHEDVPLEEVFWFAKYAAVSYSDVEMSHTLILHISSTDQQEEFKAKYRNA